MRLGLSRVWSAMCLRLDRVWSWVVFGSAARIWGALRMRSAAYACAALLVGLDQARVVETCLERTKVVVVRMGAGNLEVPDEHLRALGLRTIWVSIG